MTVVIRIGRRVPRSFLRRGITRAKGLLTFQENIWQMIIQSLNLAKKKADKDGRMKFVINKETENEDINYMIQWRKVIIMGTKEMEQDEYKDSLKFYDNFKKNFKSNFDKNSELSKRFKTTFLGKEKVDEAYEKGFGATKNKSISQKLLEMGILTHIEKIDDYEQRDEVFFN